MTNGQPRPAKVANGEHIKKQREALRKRRGTPHEKPNLAKHGLKK